MRKYVWKYEEPFFNLNNMYRPVAQPGHETSGSDQNALTGVEMRPDGYSNAAYYNSRHRAAEESCIPSSGRSASRPGASSQFGAYLQDPSGLYGVPNQTDTTTGRLCGVEGSSLGQCVKVQKPNEDRVVVYEQNNLGGRLLPSEARPGLEPLRSHQLHVESSLTAPYEKLSRSPDFQKTPVDPGRQFNLQKITPLKRKQEVIERLGWVKSAADLDAVYGSLKGSVVKKSWDWVPSDIPSV